MSVPLVLLVLAIVLTLGMFIAAGVASRRRG
jgi:hypothetical protein